MNNSCFYIFNFLVEDVEERFGLFVVGSEKLCSFRISILLFVFILEIS